jgi:hypothetical protein
MRPVDEDLLIERIRSPKPNSQVIVAESFPVTSFGDINLARTVTVGINPSVDEFRSRAKGRPVLSAGAKRFVDREVLDLGNNEVPTVSEAKRILEGNHRYFDVNPYHWFNGLQDYALDSFGLSFRNGTTAHLDLVQWATQPVWRGISEPGLKTKLVETDREFLREVLLQKSPELVLLNGAFVSDEFTRQGLFKRERETQVKGADRKLVIIEGTVLGAPAIGWNMNIQAQNTNADRERLRDRLASLNS